MDAEFLIRHFKLEPLTIEGGQYNLYYRADEHVPAHGLPERYTKQKALANAICYLHLPHTFSALHRLASDEIYHFYRGDPVTLLLLYPDRRHEIHTLGHAFEEGHEPFVVVPRHVWQGSFLNDGGEWALIGCSLSPAYDDEDFTLGNRELLAEEYPEVQELIRRLTPDSLDQHLETDPVKASAIRVQKK